MSRALRPVTILSTGGTIEKTYDELSGVLANQVSVLDVMLASLELRGVTVQRVALMNKDSLEMTPEDQDRQEQERSDEVDEQPHYAFHGGTFLHPVPAANAREAQAFRKKRRARV